MNVDQGTQQSGDQSIRRKTRRHSEQVLGGDIVEERDRTKRKEDDDNDKRQKKKEPKLSKKHRFDDADISLISSDNILFKVHSYHLMAASGYFRKLLAVPMAAAQRDPIHLRDKQLEIADNVGYLLDMVYTMEVDVLDYTVFPLLRLAAKWECELIRKVIHRELDRAPQDEYAFHRFNVAIGLKEPQLSAGFLKHWHDLIWGGDPNPNPREWLAAQRNARETYEPPAPGLVNEGYLEGGKMFEPGTIGYGAFLLISPTVLWALYRATHVGTTTPAKIDHNKVAKEFERLLTLAYRPKKAGVDRVFGDGSN